MKIVLSHDAVSLGRRAAEEAAAILKEAIATDGEARVVLSTGASQFTTLEALTAMTDIDWARVEMFHLDEYVGLPQTHIASFRRYLQERFVDKTHVGRVHFVDGTAECIEPLARELNRAPIHVGLIGIGQNGHIAFNDPPADFSARDAYLVVTLDPMCRHQQVHEGWFATEDDVPKQAISMSVPQIMRCKKIISAVPYAEKADAVAKTLAGKLDPMVPATILKTHDHFSLYVDRDSFSKVDARTILAGDGRSSYQLEVFEN